MSGARRLVGGADDLQHGTAVLAGEGGLPPLPHTVHEVGHLLGEALAPRVLELCPLPAHGIGRLLDSIAVAGFAVYIDPPFVLLDDTIALGQPQARALATPLGGEERKSMSRKKESIVASYVLLT